MQENSKKTNPRPTTWTSKPCTKWLNHTFSMNILQKAKRLNQFNQKLKKHLPKPISQHCWLMDWTMDEITLGVDAAEWLVHVREHEQNIRAYITAHIDTFSTVKIKYLIRPQISKSVIKKPSKSKTPSKISAHNRSVLRAIANTINDKTLKAALLKLASN